MRTARIVPALAALALAASGADAQASAGPLEPLGCIASDEAPIEGCTGARAMANAAYLAITPDGRHVYVSARDADAIVAFSRNRKTGALKQLNGAAGCVSDSSAPIDGCGVAGGLDRPSGIVTSPDGLDVYVTGEFYSSLVSLRRDPASGALTPTGCFTNTSIGDPDCVATPGLRTPIGVAIAPSGTHVYVASTFSDAITWFSRDPATGTLTPAGCVSDTPLDGCSGTAPGLDDAAWIAISPDGANLYVASRASNSIASFARDPTTGALTSLGCISGDDGSGQDPDCAAGHEIDFPQFVEVAPDGAHVYVSATDLHAIIVLARDPATGALTQIGCISDLDDAPGECDVPGVGLALPLGIAISSNSRFVYTGAFGYGSVASFARDPASGMLSQFGPCFSTEDDDCELQEQLGRAGFVALSPDDRHLYVNAPSSSTVSIFERSSSSTAPRITKDVAPVRNRRVPIPLACPQPADGGCIGTLTLETITRGVEVAFRLARYDLLAGGRRTIRVAVKKPGALKGVGRFKVLVEAAGLEPGDEIIGRSRVITIKP